VSILSAQKESIKFAEITKRMFTSLKELLNETKQDKRDKLKSKISKLEVRTDEIEERIADYLVRVSEQQLSIESSVKVRSILSIAHDLERVADIILRMSKDIERGNKQKSVFSDKQNKNITEIFGLIDLSIEQMITNLNGVYGKVDISGAIETEMAINALKTKMRKQHLKSTEKKEYDVQSGIIYRDLFFAAEKIGDHVINVSEAVRGDFGKDDEDM